MTSVFLMASLYVWVSIFPKVHPLQLRGYLMLVGVFNSCYIRLGVSSLMGFCLFMMIVSGVLVLVAFCVALVPFAKDVGRGSAKTGSGVGVLIDYLSGRAAVLGVFFLVLVVIVIMDPLARGFVRWCRLVRTVEGFLCYRDWVVLIVFLSVYLMLTVVVRIGICAKYSGALVRKKWYKS